MIADTTRTPPFTELEAAVANLGRMFTVRKDGSGDFDYRLMPGSPCIGKASDGGDLGVRFMPEMIEMLTLALELRARGIIPF